MNEQPQSGSSGNRPPSRPPKALGPAVRLVLWVFAFFMISFMWSEMRPPDKERARAAECISKVASIGLACAEYADAYDGRLPQTLDSLTNRLSSTPKRIFICPLAKDSNSYSYAFTGVTNKWNDGSNVIILREIEAHHDGTRTLLFNDGHVEQRKD
jgi:prepilin-type processing-associated H-X9-DG protein